MGATSPLPEVYLLFLEWSSGKTKPQILLLRATFMLYPAFQFVLCYERKKGTMYFSVLAIFTYQQVDLYLLILFQTNIVSLM